MPTHSTAVMGTKYVRLRKISVSPLIECTSIEIAWHPFYVCTVDELTIFLPTDTFNTYVIDWQESHQTKTLIAEGTGTTQTQMLAANFAKLARGFSELAKTARGCPDESRTFSTSKDEPHT